MIAILTSLALRAGVPERFAKIAGIAAVIALLALLLPLAKCGYDRSVVARSDASREAKTAPVIRAADANAADARLSDMKRNQTDEDAERAAVAPLPDARLSDRQRARACAVLRRQARERGDEVTPSCDLAREAEPQLDPGILANDSEAALDDYDTRHASWGRRGWDQVGRICWWLHDASAPTPDCGPRVAPAGDGR